MRRSRAGLNAGANAGVTLMELLIAVTLFSLLSLAMMYAFRIGLMAYSKTQTRLMDNRRVAGAQRILEQQIQGMIRVVAVCGGGAESLAANPPFSRAPRKALRLVSAFPRQ